MWTVQSAVELAVDADDFDVPESELDDFVESEPDEDDESDDEPFDDLLALSVSDEPDDVSDVAGDDELRLSFLKNPEPLNVTPTGWNTFLTGMTSPVSGWVASVSVSSVNDCWISIVSPVSTNL